MKSTNLCYPAVFTPEKEGGFSVSFPDFPEAHTQGDTEDEAFAMAVDCLHAAIEWRLEDKDEIPRPGRLRANQVSIPVSLDLAPKLALFEIMREQNISNVKLAEKLNVSEVVVRRMLDPKHQSKPGQYVRALEVLGATPRLSLLRRKIA